MAGHSRSKNGVASLTYVPAIHASPGGKDVDARHKAGHDLVVGLLNSLLFPRMALFCRPGASHHAALYGLILASCAAIRRLASIMS